MVDGGAPDLRSKLKDFESDPPYETRLVGFYDFLGWRSKIAEAGSDPNKIGELRRQILRQARVLAGLKEYSAPDIKFSTFSDNIVVSGPTDQIHVLHLLDTLGAFTMASVGGGYLVRGGVTVGEICHDNSCVFGPALNRAYELESKVAVVPRILVDEQVLLLAGGKPFFVERDKDGLLFINPFTVRYIKQLGHLEEGSDKDVYGTLGMPRSKIPSVKSVPPELWLRVPLEKLKVQIRSPLPDHQWEKVAWLFDRIASELGVPLARSYPRVRPNDEAS